MKEVFDNAIALIKESKIQESFNEANKMSFGIFSDFIFYCKEKTKFLKDPVLWSSLRETRYFSQFFDQQNSYLYLADFFRNTCSPAKVEGVINFLTENQPEVLIKAIRVSKAFLDYNWYCIFEKQFQNHPNKYLRDHFQCFTLLRQIDSDLWRNVEKKSTCLNSFENSPLELLNELALWYETNSNPIVSRALKQNVEVLNFAVDYLLKNQLLDIDESISEKDIIEANLKALNKVKNFEKNHRVTPVTDWLNMIRNWKDGANIFLQRYCFDLNYKPDISNEGIISLKPVSVEKIKEWENNGRKISMMFSHYSEIDENKEEATHDRGTFGGPPLNDYEQFVDSVHLSAEQAWIDTFNDENIFINGKEINYKNISRLFRDYSKSCLFDQKEFYSLGQDSYSRLIHVINQYDNKIESSVLLDLLVCNGNREKSKYEFDRHRVKTNLCSTPFLKFGDHLFVFTLIIANTRPLAFLFDNLLNQNDEIINKGTKNENKLSAKFEDQISTKFLAAGFYTNLGNDKKFINEDTGEQGDLDALAYKDGYLFIIEAKLAGMRVTLEDAQNELNTAFLKGASQLNKAVKFIEFNFENIRKKLGIKEESFHELKIYPLIVSTSFESDHERIGWGDKSFLKISWHELMLILSEESNPQKIVERIEKNEFWKFLEVMPTPSITEKSIPIALFSEPEHLNSVEICRLANAYYENGKYREAIITINQAIDKDDSNSDFYVLLGDCYAEINDIEYAKIAYETAIEKDPYNSKAYNSYGCFWQENERWKRSYQCFKKAIELNPLDKVIVNSFGSACDYLVDYGIWTIQQKRKKFDELKKRIDQIYEIETIRQFS